jgi:multiple sugar transport system permease protein
LADNPSRQNTTGTRLPDSRARRARGAHGSASQIALLLPALIPVLLLSLIPLIRGVYLGFTDYRLGDPIRFNGVDNYVRMFHDLFFWNSFQVGFVWTIIVTAGQVLLGLGLALLLKRKVRFTSIYSALMLVPWAMPPIIRGIVWRQVYDPDTGILNAVLLQAGLIHTSINWLSSFEFVIPAVIVAGIWGEIPKAAVFLLAGLQSIPDDLYEAARIDGAGKWKEFSRITLPMLSPVLAAVVSLSFMWNFNTFGIVWVLTQGGPGGLTRLPMLAAYEEAFRYGYVGYAAAIGNVMVLIISIVLFSYLRLQLRGSRT